MICLITMTEQISHVGRTVLNYCLSKPSSVCTIRYRLYLVIRIAQSAHILAGGALQFFNNSTVTSKLKCGHPSRGVREFKNPYSQTLKFNMAEFGIPVTEYCMSSYIFSLMCCERKYCVFY